MHNRPLRVAWPDVAAVVLFHQYAGQARVPYVGLRLRPGVRRPGTTTFNRRSRLWAVNRGLFPGIPEAVLVRSRPITGWHLDEGRPARGDRRLRPRRARAAPGARRLGAAARTRPVSGSVRARWTPGGRRRSAAAR
jgi:hypothetical protein